MLVLLSLHFYKLYKKGGQSVKHKGTMGDTSASGLKAFQAFRSTTKQFCNVKKKIKKEMYY